MSKGNAQRRRMLKLGIACVGLGKSGAVLQGACDETSSLHTLPSLESRNWPLFCTAESWTCETKSEGKHTVRKK